MEKVDRPSALQPPPKTPPNATHASIAEWRQGWAACTPSPLPQPWPSLSASCSLRCSYSQPPPQPACSPHRPTAPHCLHPAQTIETKRFLTHSPGCPAPAASRSPPAAAPQPEQWIRVHASTPRTFSRGVLLVPGERRRRWLCSWREGGGRQPLVSALLWRPFRSSAAREPPSWLGPQLNTPPWQLGATQPANRRLSPSLFHTRAGAGR